MIITFQSRCKFLSFLSRSHADKRVSLVHWTILLCTAVNWISQFVNRWFVVKGNLWKCLAFVDGNSRWGNLSVLFETTFYVFWCFLWQEKHEIWKKNCWKYKKNYIQQRFESFKCIFFFLKSFIYHWILNYKEWKSKIQKIKTDIGMLLNLHFKKTVEITVLQNLKVKKHCWSIIQVSEILASFLCFQSFTEL